MNETERTSTAQAVEYIQGDAFLWGIGELDAHSALLSIAKHLGINQLCIEDALQFEDGYESLIETERPCLNCGRSIYPHICITRVEQ
jgi:hypothetical protein